jgi:hypothetical protein
MFVQSVINRSNSTSSTQMCATAINNKADKNCPKTAFLLQINHRCIPKLTTAAFHTKKGKRQTVHRCVLEYILRKYQGHVQSVLIPCLGAP